MTPADLIADFEKTTKFAAALREVERQIDDLGTFWLEAIETVFRKRSEREEIRHEIEYRFQEDGGRLYDGPTDDSALAYLREWIEDQERHLRSLRHAYLWKVGILGPDRPREEVSA